MNRKKKIPQLDWLNPLKAFALLAILLNHLVEEFGHGPWFTNPSENWPDFATRMTNIFPKDYSFPVSLVQFLGWLGDSGPGVFILASGFGLTWVALHKPKEEMHILDFYKRRLVRIFPLYIAIHFVILAGSLILPTSNFSLASPYTLLSLLGLRFTDSLFFYINPSWWFIWLILQLYLIFPFLYALLERRGIKKFLLMTCTFTFLSRLLGLLGVRYSHSLYYWMTGIFFGTRLAEFCLGMVLAIFLKRLQENNQNVPSVRSMLAISFPTYLIGLISSFTLPGSIVANLLVTLGLSGLFYMIWAGVIKKIPLLAGLVTWIGIEAYSVYLLHQTPLKWTGALSEGKMHLLAALLVLGISFPAGWLINRAVSKLQLSVQKRASDIPVRAVTWIVGSCVLIALLFLEPRLESIWKYRFFSLILGLFLTALGLVEFVSSGKERLPDRLFRWTVIFAACLQLFLFPPGSVVKTLPLGGFFAVVSLIPYHYFRSKILAWSTSLAGLILLTLILEFTLRYYALLEAGRWGEFPALQPHPTRVYALKPNQVTHLKYNNYDYVLRTNSLGLASPEIVVARPTPDTLRILVIGDAFSMPEGMEYEYAYPALLEKEIADKFVGRPVQVINAGVTGYGPIEQHPQLQELAPLLKPDIVIYEFFINEFQEAHITPEERLKNIGFISERTATRQKILAESQTLAHLRQLRSRVKELLTGKPAEWRYWKSLLGFYRAGESTPYSQEKLAKVRSYLEAMNTICQNIGSTFIIYFVPGAVAVSQPSDIEYFPWDQDLSDKSRYDLERPFDNLRKITDELGVPVVDLTPHLKEHPHQPVYFPGSWHWNKEGHKVVARVIAQDLAVRGLLEK